MEFKLVSIIILSYNNLEYIKDTIDSILVQSYENIEIIIGDDSTQNFNIDDYYNYINEKNINNIKNIIIYKNDINLGTVKNINEAIRMSSGEYIKIIAADDLIYSDETIYQMIHYMENTKADIITTNILHCDVNMNRLPTADKDLNIYRKFLPIGKNPIDNFKLLCSGNKIPAPGVLFRKNIFDIYGEFNEKYILMEDWPMWLKISREGQRIDYLDIISVKYRVGAGISTSDKINPTLKQDYINCIKNEILPYKEQIGYWLYRNIVYSFKRECEFESYTKLKKILFLISYIDIVTNNQINKFINILKRLI